MKKFTIVCVRKDDSAYETRVSQVHATTADEASEHTEKETPLYIVVAIFPGWHDEV